MTSKIVFKKNKLLLHLLFLLKKRSKRRKHWVHPISQKRERGQEGRFNVLLFKFLL